MIQHPFDFNIIADKVMDAIFVSRAMPLEAPGPEIVYTNEAYNKLARGPVAQTTGDFSNVLEKSYSDERIAEKIRQAMESQQPLKVSYQRADSDCWLELQVLPMENNVGEVAYFAFIERDITDRKKLQQILQEQPERGLPSRLPDYKSLEKILAREFSLFGRSNTTFSVLIIDVDHFGDIRNAHGKLSGEQILHTMTTMLGNTFRSYDEIFLIGPDTFCILLSQTSLQSALITAIRFRQSIQKTAFLIDDGSINLTVCIGVSEVNTNDIQPTDVLKRAEMATIQAKKSGGDQAQIYSEGNDDRPGNDKVN